MSYRWTLRLSGSEKTTIAVKFHVPREMVDWLIDNARTEKGQRFSETSAMDWIRHQVGPLSDGWHTIYVDGGRQPWIVQVDEVENDGTYDGQPAYPGELL